MLVTGVCWVVDNETRRTITLDRTIRATKPRPDRLAPRRLLGRDLLECETTDGRTAQWDRSVTAPSCEFRRAVGWMSSFWSLTIALIFFLR